MYCPDCGTENLRGQKFCTRCGTNLIAIDRARSIIAEVATGSPAGQLEVSSLLKIIASISVLGFLIVTGGAIVLTGMSEHHGPPLGLFLGFIGYPMIYLICRQLMKLITLARPAAPPVAHPTLTGTTNRSLGEAPPAYYSVTEQATKQFEGQRGPER